MADIVNLKRPFRKRQERAEERDEPRPPPSA
jgi:hypothetical protein